MTLAKHYNPKEAEAAPGAISGNPAAFTSSTLITPARFFPSIRRPPPFRATCTWGMSIPTATPTSSPATSACAAATSTTRWVLMITACPPSAWSKSAWGSAWRRWGEPPSSRNACRSAKKPSRITRSSGSAWACRSIGAIPTARSKHARGASRSFPSSTWRAKGWSTGSEAPGIWCPECQTAIAQAELEDMQRQSEYVHLAFTRADGSSVTIATTRPELLPACVAVFVHPDDRRYQSLVGQSLSVPLFGQVVPVLADPAADPEKGTGVVMCCTFGDTTDVAWQQRHNLPMVQALDRAGRMTAAAGAFAGLPIAQARQQIKQSAARSGCCSTASPRCSRSASTNAATPRSSTWWRRSGSCAFWMPKSACWKPGSRCAGAPSICRPATRPGWKT